MSINAHKMPPINQIPHAVADVAADPSDVWSVDKYYPSPPDGGTIIRRKHLAITRAFQIARLGRRVRLISSRFRAHFHYPRRRPPALNGENSRNADVPRLAAIAARSRTSMQANVNAAPLMDLPYDEDTPDAEIATLCSSLVWSLPNLRKAQEEIVVDVMDPLKGLKRLIAIGGARLIPGVAALSRRNKGRRYRAATRASRPRLLL